MGLSLAPVSLGAGRQKSSFNSSNGTRAALGPDRCFILLPPYITAPVPPLPRIQNLYHIVRDSENAINTQAWLPLYCYSKIAVISLFSLPLELNLLNCIYLRGAFEFSESGFSRASRCFVGIAASSLNHSAGVEWLSRAEMKCFARLKIRRLPRLLHVIAARN